MAKPTLSRGSKTALIDACTTDGYIVKDVKRNGGNLWRTADALINRGFAVEIDDENVVITDLGFQASGVQGDMPEIDTTSTVQVFTGEVDTVTVTTDDEGTVTVERTLNEPADQPVATEDETTEPVETAVETTSDETSKPAQTDTEPAAEPIEVTYDYTPVDPATADGAVSGEEGRIGTAVRGLRVYHQRKLAGGCTKDGHRKGVMTGETRIKQGVTQAEVVLDCGHTRWPLLRVLIAETDPAQATPVDVAA